MKCNVYDYFYQTISSQYLEIYIFLMIKLYDLHFRPGMWIHVIFFPDPDPGSRRPKISNRIRIQQHKNFRIRIHIPGYICKYQGCTGYPAGRISGLFCYPVSGRISGDATKYPAGYPARAGFRISGRISGKIYIKTKLQN